MKTTEENIKNTIENLDPLKLMNEQKQELFEAIRHLLKYQAYSKLSDVCALPNNAESTMESLVQLFEIHYEGKDNERPS